MNVTSLSFSNSDPVSLLAILISIASFAGSVIIIFYENQIKKTNSVQEKLREDRRKFYFDLLDPYLFLFRSISMQNLSNQEIKTPDDQAAKRTAIENEFLQKALSPEYKKTSAELILLGSDKVIKAYNELVHYTALKETTVDNDTDLTIIVLFASLFLEIRKDLGAHKTKLAEDEILKCLNFKEVDKLNIPDLKRKYKLLKLKNKK